VHLLALVGSLAGFVIDSVGVSVMVWGGISYDGSTDLYVIRNGSLTGIRYCDEILAPIVSKLVFDHHDNLNRT
jgi:hypothetical protein